MRGFSSQAPAVRASLLMWSAALAVGGFALVTQRWSHAGSLVVGGMLGLACLSLINRVRLGARVPDWLNHVDAIAGAALVSIAILFDGPRTGEFSVLYVLIGLFVAFFMSPRASILYGLVIAGAYGAVLTLGPPARDPVDYWVALVVVVAVGEAVVLSLVAQMRQLAACDPLTGLPNRRAWDERLDDVFAQSARRGRRLSVAIIDLNGFKEVNDREGHLAGDRILIALADRWRVMDRPPRALFARIGGDEFALLAPDADAALLESLAGRVAATLPAGVTFSVGAVTWDGRETVASLIRRADRAMYRMKEAQQSRHATERALGDVVAMDLHARGAVL